MNQQAEKHLAKAEGYLAKGDDWYGRAADEIIAAQEADPTLSNRQIAQRFGRSDRWVSLIVQWRTNAKPDSDTPIDWKRGSHGTKAEIEKGVEKALADPKRVEQVVKANPAAVSKALAEDDDFAFDAMTDPQARLNAAAASHTHQEAARSQTRSEEKARNKAKMNQEEYDGLLLLKLGGAEQRIIDAAEVAARNWKDNRADLSEQGLDLALDHLAGTQVKLNKILDEIRGQGLDAVLAEIQAD